MFLQASVTVNHTRHASVLEVSTQQCLISFESAANSKELEFNLFNKILRGKCTWFIYANSGDFHTL